MDRGRCCCARARRPRRMARDAERRNAQAPPVGLGEPVPADAETALVLTSRAGNIQPPRADSDTDSDSDADTEGNESAPGGTDQPADAPPDNGSPASRTDADRPDTAGDTGTHPVHSASAPGATLADRHVPGAHAVEDLDLHAVPQLHPHPRANGRWHRRADHDVVHLRPGGRRRSAHGRRRGGRRPRVLVGRRGPARPRSRPARHPHRHRELRQLLVPDLVGSRGRSDAVDPPWPVVMHHASGQRGLRFRLLCRWDIRFPPFGGPQVAVDD